MQRASNKVTVGVFCCSFLCCSMAVSCRLGESLDGYSSGSGADALEDSQDSSVPWETSMGGSGGSAGAGGAGGGNAGQGGGAGTGGSGGAGGSGGIGGSGGGAAAGGTGGGGPVEGLSCNGLPTTCGDKGNTSCCSSLSVPGGSFPMGRSTGGSDKCPSGVECLEHETPEHAVTVSKFSLDEFEVTVGRFRRFVEKYDEEGTKPKPGAGAHPKIDGSGWKGEWNDWLPSTVMYLKSELKCDGKYGTWRDMAGDTEQRPINCVSWYVAFAFCAWDGGRLPTEAEWEFAAAGGAENRLYPWGQEALDDTRAAYQDSSFSIVKVGTFPAGKGRWGHKDLTGNLWEWVLDGYDSKWYSGGGSKCMDCANLTGDNTRVVRGGSIQNSAIYLRAASRNNFSPSECYFFDGFRCARDL